MASVIESELLLDYQGSTESGLLRDPAIPAWRKEHRGPIEDLLAKLNREADDLPREPVSEAERMLLRAFGMDEGQGNA